jgi:hypothetical protein
MTDRISNGVFNDGRTNIAAGMTAFVAALACFAVVPLAALAHNDMEIAPLQLALATGGSFALGAAAQKILRRVQSVRATRTVMLVLAAWAVGGLSSMNFSHQIITMQCVVCVIGAALFAMSLESLSTRAAAAIGVAGIAVAQVAMPAIFRVFTAKDWDSDASWRVPMIGLSFLVLLIACVQYGLTRPATETADVSEPARAEAPDEYPAAVLPAMS